MSGLSPTGVSTRTESSNTMPNDHLICPLMKAEHRGAVYVCVCVCGL